MSRPGKFFRGHAVTGFDRFSDITGHKKRTEPHKRQRLNETEETGQQKESRKSQKSQKSRPPLGIQVRHTAYSQSPTPTSPPLRSFLFGFWKKLAPFSHRVFNEIISPAKPPCQSNITWGKPYATDCTMLYSVYGNGTYGRGYHGRHPKRKP